MFNGENGPLAGVAVVNGDDPYGKRLLGELPKEAARLSFGLSEGMDFQASNLSLGSGGSRFLMKSPEGDFEVSSPLVGAYNVSNALAAIALAGSLGVSVAQSVQALSGFAGIPGRMEPVRAGQSFQVLVDYAHTEDALVNALEMLREVTPGKLLLVFGCGGNRDKGKRSAMTRAASRLADMAWATSDNPRNEKIDAIFADMKRGLEAPDRVAFVADRRRALALALEACRAGDCLLIAGKGHETFQEYGETVVPFDDRKVAAELLEAMSIGGRS